MSYNLLHTIGTLQLQKDVIIGQSVDREGVVLRGLLEGGVEKVQKADASSNAYRIVGFAISDNESMATRPRVEDATIPAAPGPYTVALSRTGIVGTAGTAEIRVRNNTAAADMTQTAGAPADDEFQPAVATGIITFNSADAGASITVFYRQNLTVLEARQEFFQRNINNEAGSIFNTVTVLGGHGEIWTYEYDAAQDYSSNPALVTGVDGVITVGGGGTAIPGGRVTKVPSVDDPALGIAFDIPV